MEVNTLFYQIATFVIATAVVLVVLYVIVRVAVWFKTRALQQELEDLKERYGALQLQNDNLRSDEPAKVQLLREELFEYDQLIDRLQTHLTRRVNPLELSHLAEQIANLIEIYRPKRRI